MIKYLTVLCRNKCVFKKRTTKVFFFFQHNCKNILLFTVCTQCTCGMHTSGRKYKICRIITGSTFKVTTMLECIYSRSLPC